jgi:hypothetical protein
MFTKGTKHAAGDYIDTELIDTACIDICRLQNPHYMNC